MENLALSFSDDKATVVAHPWTGADNEKIVYDKRTEELTQPTGTTADK